MKLDAKQLKIMWSNRRLDISLIKTVLFHQARLYSPLLNYWQ